MHFAGLKAVGESVAKPTLYYNNNLIGTITLLEVMAAHGCKKVIPFCSDTADFFVIFLMYVKHDLTFYR